MISGMVQGQECWAMSGRGFGGGGMVTGGSGIGELLMDFRDWSLITGRGWLQNGEIFGSETFCAPPPQARVKLFAPPLLKRGNFSRPPYNMAKTSSYRIKTTPKLFVPPLQHG